MCACYLRSSWGNDDGTVALCAASASDVTALVLDFLSASMFTSHLLS